MYEDRTQDNITAEMLARFGQGVRTDEASLAYNACVQTGSELEEFYEQLSDLNGNTLPDTMDIDHLIRYAGERGISYKYATSAVVLAKMQQETAIGSRLTCNDFIYSVTSVESADELTYLLTCEEEGTEPNGTLGELDPVDFIDGWVGGEIIEIVAPGTDDEDEEIFRSRILETFDSLAFGGNKADYRLYIDALTGVGGCKPKRRDTASRYINIYVISSEFNVPSDTFISELQTIIDPLETSGEGDGIAPMCHLVRIQPVGSVEINISATLTLDTGYTLDTIKPQVESAIDSYLLSLRKAWESNEQNTEVVRLSRIEQAILTIEGVIDVTNTKINGSENNTEIVWTSTPILGAVTVEEG